MKKEVFPVKAYEIDKIEKWLASLNYEGISLVVNSRTLNISDTEKNKSAYKFDFAISDARHGKVGILKVTWIRSPIFAFKLDEIRIDKRFRYDPKKVKGQQYHFGTKVFNLFEEKFIKGFKCVGVLYDAIKDMSEWYPGNRKEKANPLELHNFYENRGWHKVFPNTSDTKTRYFSSRKLTVKEIIALQEYSENGVF